MKGNYHMKIEELKEEIRELNNKNQNNTTHVEERNIRNSNIEISKPVFYGSQKDQHPIVSTEFRRVLQSQTSKQRRSTDCRTGLSEKRCKQLVLDNQISN